MKKFVLPVLFALSGLAMANGQEDQFDDPREIFEDVDAAEVDFKLDADAELALAAGSFSCTVFSFGNRYVGVGHTCAQACAIAMAYCGSPHQCKIWGC